MRYARLNDLPSGYKLVLGLGAATSLAAAGVLLIGAPGSSRPPRLVQSHAVSVNHAVVARAAVGAPAAKSAPVTPTRPSAQLLPPQAVFMKAKYPALSSLPLGGRESVQAPPPAAPELVGVEAPAAQASPAPQPMEAAVQTADAPAPLAPVPAKVAKINYFGGGTSSVQHLPIESH